MLANRMRIPLRQQREADITELQLTNWGTLFILGGENITEIGLIRTSLDVGTPLELKTVSLLFVLFAAI